MGLKAYNVICTNDISEDYDVDALGATNFEAYACDDVDEYIGKLNAVLAEKDAEIRRLQRALWIAREWRAWCEGQFWLAVESDKPRDIYHLLLTSRIHRTPNEWNNYWQNVEQLCGNKAKEYK